MRDHELAMCAYVQLAVLSHEKQQFLVRDRFLLLASIEACRAGWLAVAEYCRTSLVESNKGHQLAKHSSVADALRDDDFQRLVARWERYCSYEQAEHLLLQLGREPAGDQPDVPRGEWMLQLLQQNLS
jgi:hypothetical protein